MKNYTEFADLHSLLLLNGAAGNVEPVLPLHYSKSDASQQAHTAFGEANS